MPENAQKYIRSLEIENNILREKLRLTLYQRFGRSSEKIDPDQQELFGDDEIEFDVPETEESTTIVRSHTRKKSDRKPLDPKIPREEVIHDIPEEEKICGWGARLRKVDELISEELEIIPEQVFVKCHIDPKDACRCCDGSGDEDKPVFRVARSEPRLLPGSIVSPSLLAFILVNKFPAHLPIVSARETI